MPAQIGCREKEFLSRSQFWRISISVDEENSDRELVARLKCGDVGAFDQVFEAYRSRLFGYLLRMTRQRELAEDIVQETWLQLARKAPLLAADSRLGAWLFTVGRNLCLSRFRRHSLEEEVLSNWVRMRSDPAGNCPFRAAAGNELQLRIETALEVLPPLYREALALVGIEDFTPAEAAAICGLRPEAFRKRLSRAREMLTRALSADPVAAQARTGKGGA
jgi:RNA polymerase sigma-70 factor (ECF subfamily)